MEVVTIRIQDGWMLRECQQYYEELKSCESMNGRFNQLYIEGRTADCGQWREDHEDCKVLFSFIDKVASQLSVSFLCPAR